MTASPQFLPAEWVRHSAVWVGWPRLEDEWGAAFDPTREEITAFIKTLVRYVPVCVAAGDSNAVQSAKQMLPAAVEIMRVATGDIWLRDTGPVFTRGAVGMRANCFGFNGWGGKFDMPGDRETATDIASLTGAPTRHEFILEGGAIETDGAGIVLTTRACLLNPNRNQEMCEADYARQFAAAFGTQRIIWLDDGLPNDHTDGHIDNIARCVAPGHVVCQRAEPGHPHHQRLSQIEAQLRDSGLNVSLIDAPPPVLGKDGEVLPASHMNYLVTNGVVLLPAYDEAMSGRAAVQLAGLFPDRQIIALPSRAILSGGGSFHCMTCHVPAIEDDAR